MVSHQFAQTFGNFAIGLLMVYLSLGLVSFMAKVFKRPLGATLEASVDALIIATFVVIILLVQDRSAALTPHAVWYLNLATYCLVLIFTVRIVQISLSLPKRRAPDPNAHSEAAPSRT